MTHMCDEIVLARIMTALGLEFEKALHYHEEGYESNNDYGLPAQVMRPVCVYSVSTTKASFKPHQLQGSTMSHLSLHAQMNQGHYLLIKGSADA